MLLCLWLIMDCRQLENSEFALIHVTAEIKLKMTSEDHALTHHDLSGKKESKTEGDVRSERHRPVKRAKPDM